MQQSKQTAKIWDGAALVSRSTLEGMALAGDFPADTQAQRARQLAGMQRVEFTLLTAKGQDKGHAIVVDDLRDDAGNPVDFLLPEDTKTQIKLTNGQTFVGFNPVHGHNAMRLDVQSLINLTPFFAGETLLDYVKDEGKLFMQSIAAGDVAPIIGRISGLTDNHQTALSEAYNQWPLRALLASGGDPTQYRSHIKTLVNQHLQRLNHQTLDKMRLPLPGGRHYVMPMAVAKRAGLDKMDHVGRGEIFIDDKRATAWVNDQDWLAMQDSQNNSGIASILGGADHDDGLWLYGFTDHDGQRKILTWRSPNQVGEYVLLKPTAHSAEFQWTTASGDTISYPTADSRNLPQRIDGQQVRYLDVVDPDSAGGIGEEIAHYTPAAMQAALERTVANQGVLGMYCNALMLHQGLYGTTPATLPAPLEDVIDSAVKTGADVSKVREWCFEHSRQILASRQPIPLPLQRRLNIDKTLPADQRPSRPSHLGAETHWLAQLQTGLQQHITAITTQRDELVAHARPPQALFEAVANDAEGAALGREFNRRFGAALHQGGMLTKFSQARRSAEDYLSHFAPAMQRRILRGALASVYNDEGNAVKSDAAVWLS
ncbi:MAG TPA: hypothetical protein ENJ56_08665, partial [Anaerolineae bacterium]|nr:hypothetical protein [Anaerolineae bacterium]